MKSASLLCLAAASIALAACDLRPTSSYGFRLPDGDATRGQAVFIEKQCGACHTIAGMDALRTDVEVERTVPIGGQQTRIATYGELVTSIINPSHNIARKYRDEFSVDGESVMRSYNDTMTVSELIDLVAFLQDQYEEFPDY